MSESQHVERLVIRPSASHTRRALRAVLLFPLICVAILLIGGRLLSLAAAAIVTAGCLAAVAVYMRRLKIVVSPTELTRVGFTGISKRWPRAEIGGVLQARLPDSPAYARAFDNLFVLDHTGHTMLRIRSSIWSKTDMAQLTAALGLEPEGPGPGTFVTVAELARWYPNALPQRERRPWAFSFGVVAAIVGLIIVIGVVLGVATSN
jgi:hypothetical protein